jgi:hypothetical protein
MNTELEEDPITHTDSTVMVGGQTYAAVIQEYDEYTDGEGWEEDTSFDAIITCENGWRVMLRSAWPSGDPGMESIELFFWNARLKGMVAVDPHQNSSIGLDQPKLINTTLDAIAHLSSDHRVALWALDIDDSGQTGITIATHA